MEPVAITMPVPLPVTTAAPANAMFERSETPVLSSRIALFFSAAIDSPVKKDSSIKRFFVSISLMSAGTLLPDSTSTMSPGTSSSALISAIFPVLFTLAKILMISSRAVALFSAFHS